MGHDLRMSTLPAVTLTRRLLPFALAISVLSPQVPAVAVPEPVVRNPGEPSYQVRLRGDADGHKTIPGKFPGVLLAPFIGKVGDHHRGPRFG